MSKISFTNDKRARAAAVTDKHFGRSWTDHERWSRQHVTE